LICPHNSSMIRVLKRSQTDFHRSPLLQATIMKFRAEEYYQASLERMRQARKLCDDRDNDNYALAMYCSGVAVECLLRAFDPVFDGRHDLAKLLKACNFLRVHDEYMSRRGKSDEEIQKMGRELRAAMNEVVLLWRNNLRYASEAKLRSFLKEVKRLQGIKGDALKKNTLDLVQASQTMIDRGTLLWSSKKR